MDDNNDFELLIDKIKHTEHVLQNSARLIINRHVTAKAWLIGYYIVEYEQSGRDRARYGEKLIQNLAVRLKDYKSMSQRTLKLYRQFYLTYPQLVKEIRSFLINSSIGQSVIAQLESINGGDKIGQSVITQFKEDSNVIHVDEASIVEPSKIFNQLSFTHLAAILPLKDDLQRAFYEIMSIKGTWSVRELQRQIDSNYYERSGWSKKTELLVQMVQEKVEVSNISTDIKSPFVFEFLGLNAKDVVEESDLETALIDNLQNFILELGMGFCFEERQKKMLVDDRYFKADLIFYHRILKRHVIIDLKARRLDYSDVAQMDMYLAYFKKNIMIQDDNEPIGIIMCSEVGEEMAEYTMIGVDPNLFVSKYSLELPSVEKIREFLKKENEGLL